ncbi:hypothetical protein [Neoasaia chiangmaiensis]|uniref:hypothetical protein n=1 Tax=Neoasaia chiangmaiensis TaxID=320497 RepID=UPI001478FBCF|nr:hypothetical protein [Neoasaia chiangmaiensis]
MVLVTPLALPMPPTTWIFSLVGLDACCRGAAGLARAFPALVAFGPDGLFVGSAPSASGIMIVEQSNVAPVRRSSRAERQEWGFERLGALRMDWSPGLMAAA